MHAGRQLSSWRTCSCTCSSVHNTHPLACNMGGRRRPSRAAAPRMRCIQHGAPPLLLPLPATRARARAHRPCCRVGAAGAPPPSCTLHVLCSLTSALAPIPARGASTSTGWRCGSPRTWRVALLSGVRATCRPGQDRTGPDRAGQDTRLSCRSRAQPAGSSRGRPDLQAPAPAPAPLHHITHSRWNH